MLTRASFVLLAVAVVAFGGWLWLGASADERPATAYPQEIVQAEPLALEATATAAEPATQDSAATAADATGPAALEQPASVPQPAPSSTVVDQGWLAQTAASTGIPARALAAYATATLRIGMDQPGCGIGWNTLAAIGSVESGHGSHGGAAIGDDGVVRPGIYGPKLDGVEFAHIADSDGGALDGDSSIDRAVGPFQFIPGTWATWGSDADGDGAADPQNMADAALSAARYLCSYGSLTSTESWRGAVFGYNHDNDYVDLIAARANQYGQLGR